MKEAGAVGRSTLTSPASELATRSSRTIERWERFRQFRHGQRIRLTTGETVEFLCYCRHVNGNEWVEVFNPKKSVVISVPVDTCPSS